MRRAEIIFALVLLVGAVVILIETLRTLNIGWADRGPGDGFFPFWLVVIVFISSSIVLIQALLKASDSNPKPFIQIEGLKSIGKVLAPMTAAFILINFAGFYLVAAFYLGFFMRWVGKHHWVSVIGVSLIFPLAIYFVIEKQFFIILPKGDLEWFFPGYLEQILHFFGRT